jgi:hypothetical protein
MTGSRFPWRLLLAAWLVIGIGLTIGYRHLVISGNFPDTDDYMRLQQVRDLMAGQSWFDLTQHRVNAPAGLPMHWSRLVDVPLLLFLVPLAPLLGAHAETAALIGAPLLTLLALLIAVTAILRHIVGSGAQTLLIGWLFAIMPPLVLAQIHPGRIDHHGWQIALAAGVLAALLDAKPQRSGIVAGVLTALFLTISIEGVAFAAAAIGVVSVLWIFGKHAGVRLARFAQSLGVVGVAATAIFAPVARWTETQCDAVMLGHLAAFVVFAIGVTLTVRLAENRGRLVRCAGVAFSALGALFALYAVAPQCLGNPFGTMDPLVQRIWFQNVNEGLPVWKQTPIGAVTALAFPVIGLTGAAVAWLRSHQREWLIVLLMGAATLATGALVFRAAGIAQIVAIPGAVMIVEAALSWAAARKTMVARVVLQAATVLALSPLGPVVVAAASIPDAAPQKRGAVKASACAVDCALLRLNRVPATALMNPIDLGPPLIARTHHSAYVASYHRLQQPLGDTIRYFMGSSDHARAFMQAHGLRKIVIDPNADEISVYRKNAPAGFATQLVDGKLPAWLRRVDFGGGNALLLFEVIEP